ncbi:MAG: hypothetical protein MUC29_14880 [Pyrinomonadaceae bacterium]|jgi:hypothetical protein|nr:hypothetical protein [Pyrinomonadaceae bacterium]
MVKSPIFDTNTIETFSDQIENLVEFSYFPSIVFFELIATSFDKSTFEKYTRWHNALKKSDRILTPTENDWWETSKAIRRMYVNQSAQQSKLKTIRIDALIARLSVKKLNTFIVTLDVDDFQIIQKEMPNLKIKDANEFFS